MVGTAASGSTGKRQAPCPGLLLSARESLALHAAPGRAISFVPAQEFLGIAGKVSGWFGHDHRGAPRLGGASIGVATDGCYSPGEEGGFPMLGIDRASPTDVAAWRKDKPFDSHGKTAGHGYRLGASACGIIDDRPGGRRACPGVMLKVPTRRPKHALPPPGLEALDRIPQIPYPVTARTAHLRRSFQQRGDERPFRIGAIACAAQPSSVILATSGFSPADFISVVSQTPVNRNCRKSLNLISNRALSDR